MAIQRKRLVIKLGTQVVTTPNGTGFAKKRIQGIVHGLAQLRANGHEVLLVSSGSIGLGRRVLGLSGMLGTPQKQACAAVGQGLLMREYQALFENYEQPIAQVLLTANDLSHRHSYLNLQQTLETLLELGVIPILNENDTVSTQELRADETQSASFGDNDALSALVASKLQADFLLLLTNVDGLYTANPATQPDAEKIALLEGFDALRSVSLTGHSAGGRGGMASKLQAARIAAMSGVEILMASGFESMPIERCLNLETGACQLPFPGTRITPQHSGHNAKERWIGWASGYQGIITINAGAQAALIEKNASLLAVGIIRCEGQFQAGAVVSIQDELGCEWARGICRFSADDVTRIQGQPQQPEVVHRNQLVVLREQEIESDLQ